MTDREFLIWIHERLEHVYKERSLVDFMHKLRALIVATPKNRETAKTFSGGNDMSDLQGILVKQKCKCICSKFWKSKNCLIHGS